MLRSCWFVQTVFDFSAIPIISKKYFPFNVLQELLVSGPLWQTERANQNFILQVGIREIPKSMPTNWCDSNCRDGKAEGQRVCLPSLSELLTLFWTPSLRLTEFSTRCEKGAIGVIYMFHLQEEGSESFLMISACMSSTEALADWAWLESDLLPKMQVINLQNIWKCPKCKYLVKVIKSHENLRTLRQHRKQPTLWQGRLPALWQLLRWANTGITSCSLYTTGWERQPGWEQRAEKCKRKVQPGLRSLLGRGR